MEKHFLNLTNGLEWIHEVPHFDFIRLSSTSIEKEDWNNILLELDSNFLLHLALGHTCHFYDCGTRRKTSKTVSEGLPFIRQALQKLWFEDYRADTPARVTIKRKFSYFRRYLSGPDIKLIGHSRATTHDGDKDFYTAILENFYRSSG